MSGPAKDIMRNVPEKYFDCSAAGQLNTSTCRNLSFAWQHAIQRISSVTRHPLSGSLSRKQFLVLSLPVFPAFSLRDKLFMIYALWEKQ
jgi:hypothetical protein